MIGQHRAHRLISSSSSAVAISGSFLGAPLGGARIAVMQYGGCQRKWWWVMI